MNDFSPHPSLSPPGRGHIYTFLSPRGEDRGEGEPRFDLRSWITRDIDNFCALQARKYIVSSKKVNKIIPLLSKIDVVFLNKR
jgi:hypothetical protein